MNRPHMTREKWIAIGIMAYIFIMFLSIFLAAILSSRIFLFIGGTMGILVGVYGIIGCICAIIYDENTGLN